MTAQVALAAFVNSDLEFSIFYKTRAGVPIDITGSVWQLNIRKTPGTAIVLQATNANGKLVVQNPLLGQINVAFPAAEMNVDDGFHFVELIRTDTGNDVVATFGMEIALQGAITFADPQIDAVVIFSTEVVVVQAVNAPAGPDPWNDPVQIINHNTLGPRQINYALGKHVRINMGADISALTVINWPAANKVGRLTLQVHNGAGWNILAWPAGLIWMPGTDHNLLPSAKHVFVLFTIDGGVEIFGNVVGAAYTVIAP